MRAHWRHFAPRRLARLPRIGSRLVTVSTVREAEKIVEEAVVNIGVRHLSVEAIDAYIERNRHQLSQEGAAGRLALLILQSPRAALAQRKMDQHPHGYRDKEARLYELIGFNDSYVEMVLGFPGHELKDLDDQVKRAMDRFSKRVGVRGFSDEQWEAITHGLSREIAVYRGATEEGFEVRMTSRAEDARGVDMVITDPHTRVSVNLDIKTRSAYYYRLKDLLREGRLTPEQFEAAETIGYCHVKNGHGGEAVEVVLLRIDPEVFGEVVDFSFTRPELLGRELRRLLS